MRTARAKGAPECAVLRSHILRNAMLPVVTMLGMDIGIALGGAVFTETVYSLPGLGQDGDRGARSDYDTADHRWASSSSRRSCDHRHQPRSSTCSTR